MSESALFTESLDKGILNFNPTDFITGFSDKPVRMIILTDTLFKKSLIPYIKWKTRKGFRITTLYRGEKLAGTTFTELKDTLTKIYRSSTSENPAPEYLLIVGDINIIPKFDGTTQVSDLYYGEFDGNGDYLPDMFIGRLPVRYTGDANGVVSKLVQYESFQLADTNKFHGRALITAGGETNTGFITIMNGQINYAISNYLNTANNVEAKSIPVPLAVKPDSVIRKCINDGVSFINYTGHGLGGLILDATFVSQDLRIRAAEIAESARRPFVIAECACTQEKSIERILKRTKENYESNALTREAYLNNKAIFQPIDVDDVKRRVRNLAIIHLTIDTEYNDAPNWKIKKIEKR